MTYIFLFIISAYTILIISFIIGFERVKSFNIESKTSKNSFSIIIPFRNEAENLPQLIDSLNKLAYHKKLFEILFIDDASEDNSKQIIESLMENKNTDYKIITNKIKSSSPKKDAIKIGIEHSKFDWIITTDADCIVPEKWLQSFDNFIQIKRPKMICAPVTYSANNSFLEQFQLLDFISLIGSTIGGFGINKPFLSNGANLCYSKKTFVEVDGFKGNDTISSGDDIFLLEKFYSKSPLDIHYLKSKNSIVKTLPQSSFKKLISQRVRWASKSKFYKNWFGKIVGGLVFTSNFSLLILLALSILKVLSWKFILLIFSVKFLTDLILILKTLVFTNQAKKIIYYPIIAFFHPFFIVFTAFLSIIENQFEWKKRIFKV